jgi:hypothetical protein
MEFSDLLVAAIVGGVIAGALAVAGVSVLFVMTFRQ